MNAHFGQIWINASIEFGVRNYNIFCGIIADYGYVYLFFKTIMQIPKEQRLAFRPSLKKLFPPEKVKTKEERNEAIQKAYLDYCYTLSKIARHLGLHYAAIGRIIKAAML